MTVKGKRHMKRLAAPRIRRIPRKARHGVRVVRSRPGPHPIDRSIPIALILRDMLGIAETMREVRAILRRGYVLVDGRPVYDRKFPVGSMDVITFVPENVHYRVMPRYNMHFILHKIPEEEAKIKVGKIKVKKTIKGGRIQITTHDGRNFVLPPEEKDRVKRRRSVVYEIPEQKLIDVLPLEPGNYVLIERGRNMGYHGILKTIEHMPRDRGYVELELPDGRILRTGEQYVFVIGHEKPIISLPRGEEDGDVVLRTHERIIRSVGAL